MAPSTVNLPYFDALLGLLDRSPAVQTAFRRHVHWGYWADPDRAQISPAAFDEAAEQLTREVYGTTRIQNGAKVLDVGCGFGGTIASLNQQFSNLQLTGVNIDPRQLDRAKQWVIPQNNNTIEWVEANAIELPFPDASFDVVLAVECIFHFPDRQRFFQEVRRVLKPSGQLAISDFLPSDLLALLPNLKSPLDSAGFYGGFDVTYTLNSYRNLAQETGFRLTQARDITAETLPTYSCFRSMAVDNQWFDPSAMVQTLAIELASRLRALNYWILQFDRW
ncbi:MAG: class I SAM-dependent methyltransferase [Limnothrix sp. BL-A-16]|jgi:ubiquinone/menaquinone biosynthesis C-methylase UbiE